jgi:hypothetical protein
MKWLLASAVMGESAMPYVNEHITERIGTADNMSFIQYFYRAIINNFRCLFPLEQGVVVILVTIALAMVIAYLCLAYHKLAIESFKIAFYAFIAIIPYIRFVFLHNHSILHYFFTYRAQAAAIFALALIINELVDWRWLFYANKKTKTA